MSSRAMRYDESLVSVCLPVRNGAGAGGLQHLIPSVLAQTHSELELVISDNASTDATEDVCRHFAASDTRVVYRRQPENIGIVNNFTAVARMSRGGFFRWVGDSDWLPPHSIAQCRDALLADTRAVMLTTGVSYRDADGAVSIGGQHAAVELASPDPIARFTEFLRLLNESRMTIDPIFGFFRREPAVSIPRRVTMREDEVFAANLALAGPWAHVPEVLIHQTLNDRSLRDLARLLGVPMWQAHAANIVECSEILRSLGDHPLTREQRRRARAAVLKLFARRQQRMVSRRARKVVRLATTRSQRA